MPQQTQKKTNPRKIFLTIIFILVIGFGFGFGKGTEALAENLGSPIQDINTLKEATGDGNADSCDFLFHPIDCTLLALLDLFVKLTTLASTLFKWIMGPNNISSILSSKAIYEGWALVRDALNVSFIMFLLFSAFATVFQIDKYSYKKTLLTIVIMALLVNFSFPISRFIIDVSNMMMYYFADTLSIGSDKKDIIVGFADIADLPNILHPKVGNDTTSLLAAVVFAFIFMITMLTISVLFVIRTLALAVLIIFSSLAFVGTAVPPLAKHSGDWWKKLFDYSFFGPIMLFMMYIASSLMNEIQKDGLINMTELSIQNTKSGAYVASLAFFFLPIIILWIGLGIAKEMSGSAGSAIVGKAQGFMKGAGKWTASPITSAYKAGKFGAGALVKKIDRDHIGVRGFIKAWKDRSSEIDTDKVATQAAKSRDRISNFPLFFDKDKRDPNYYRDVDDANKIAKYKKEQDLYSTTDVDLVEGIRKLSGKKDTESGQRMQAFFQTLAGNKDLNEFGKLKYGYFDPNLTKNDIANTLRESLNEEDVVSAMHDLEDINIMNGVYSMYGLTTIDKETGKRRLTKSSTEQEEAVMGKLKNIDYQKFMINFHPDSVITEAKDGSPTGISNIGKSILEYVESRDAEFVSRLRGDARDKIKEAIRIHDEKAEPADKISTKNPVLMFELSGGKKGQEARKAAILAREEVKQKETEPVVKINSKK